MQTQKRCVDGPSNDLSCELLYVDMRLNPWAVGIRCKREGCRHAKTFVAAVARQLWAVNRWRNSDSNCKGQGQDARCSWAAHSHLYFEYGYFSWAAYELAGSLGLPLPLGLPESIPPVLILLNYGLITWRSRRCRLFFRTLRRPTAACSSLRPHLRTFRLSCLVVSGGDA